MSESKSFEDLVQIELRQSAGLLNTVLQDVHFMQKVASAAKLMGEALKSSKKIISCGNGGSHCDAMHFAEELSGRYRDSRKALAAIAISDPSHISCTANDFGFQYVFSRFIEGLGAEGDVLLAISTSGNSNNVVEAAKVAKSKGIKVVSLSGNDGGALASLSDVEIRVPHQGYADRIQEIHIKVIHILILLIEKQLGYAS